MNMRKLVPSPYAVAIALAPLALTVSFDASATSSSSENGSLENGDNQIIRDQTRFIGKSLRHARGGGGSGRPSTASSGSPSSAGMAAGSAADWAVFGSFEYSASDDSTPAVGFDGRHFQAIIGVDRNVGDLIGGDAIAGVALNFAKTDADDATKTSDSSEKQFGISLYGNYLINDWLDATAAVNYTRGENELTFAAATASLDTDSYFIDLATTGTWSSSNFSIATTGEFIWAESFTGSDLNSVGGRISGFNSYLGQIALEFSPSYLFDLPDGGAVASYALARYEYDFSRDKVTNHPNDNDGFILGVGASAYFANGVSADLNAEITMGRENIDKTAVMGLIRADF